MNSNNLHHSAFPDNEKIETVINELQDLSIDLRSSGPLCYYKDGKNLPELKRIILRSIVKLNSMLNHMHEETLNNLDY